MSPAYCRRQFLTRSLLLAGAAALLPAQRLSAATAIGGSQPAPSAADPTQNKVVDLISRYGRVTGIESSGTTTRIAVVVRCYDTMLAALAGGAAHGISRIQADGTVTAFSIQGRRFEIDNRHHVA